MSIYKSERWFSPTNNHMTFSNELISCCGIVFSKIIKNECSSCDKNKKFCTIYVSSEINNREGLDFLENLWKRVLSFLSIPMDIAKNMHFYINEHPCGWNISSPVEKIHVNDQQTLVFMPLKLLKKFYIWNFLFINVDIEICPFQLFWKYFHIKWYLVGITTYSPLGVSASCPSF